MKPQHEADRGKWSMPEDVKVDSIMVVEHGRLPIDEAVVKDIMATIAAGNMSALPPIHLWRKRPDGNAILVAGRNRFEAHKRSGCEVISARIITGDAPEIVRVVQLIEIDENLNRRELSPALRRSLSKQRKALYEEEHPETKRGSAGGRAKAGKGAKSQNATEQTPAFIDAHAKQTGRHRATIAREISEAEKIGDDRLKRIVGTSLDKKTEITALAAMDELERQQIIERAVAGETVSALKPEGMSEDSKTTQSFGTSAYKLASGLAAVPTAVLQNKLNKVVQRRGDLPAKERRFLADALRAVAKRFEQIADKIDINEPREMISALTEKIEDFLRESKTVDMVDLQKLPVEKQRSVAEVARTGEQVSPVTAFSACGPGASKTSDGTGKEVEPAPTLDPRAWSISTAQERAAFVKAIGRSEIENVLNAIEPSYATTWRPFFAANVRTFDT
jgi:ParB-like chromosome segregation protein Spo0J